MYSLHCLNCSVYHFLQYLFFQEEGFTLPFMLICSKRGTTNSTMKILPWSQRFLLPKNTYWQGPEACQTLLGAEKKKGGGRDERTPNSCFPLALSHSRLHTLVQAFFMTEVFLRALFGVDFLVFRIVQGHSGCP